MSALLVLAFVGYFLIGVFLFRLIKLLGLRVNNPESEVQFAAAVLILWPLIGAVLLIMALGAGIIWCVERIIKFVFFSRLFKKTMGIS